MADNSATLRNLSIAHMVIGILIICLGITDRFEGLFWTGDFYFGIWIGTWICISGIFGMFASLRETTSSRKAFIGVLLFFFIISALLGLAVVAIYGFFIVILRNIAAYIRTFIAIASMFVTLGIVETVIGIWSAICCCRLCCFEPERQFLIPVTDAESISTGEFMTQRAVRVATLNPVQGDDSCDATQEWSGLLPVMPVPTFGATGNQPQPVGAPMSVSLQAAGGFEVAVQASESVAQGGRH